MEQDFAGSLKKLDEIVKSLESGELSLEDSLKKFEEGVRLSRQLEEILDRAEKKVSEVLQNKDPSEDTVG